MAVKPSADHLLEQPVPEVGTEQAEETARRLFGIVGEASPLESERDRNFLIDGDRGSYKLKFANPAEDSSVLSMQAAALTHISLVDPGLPVPRNLPTVDGAAVGSVRVDGLMLPVRMVSFLPGATLEQGISSDRLRESIATTLARLGLALRGFFDPEAGRVLLWDLKHLPAMRSKLDYLRPDQQSLVGEWLDRFDQHVAPLLPHLRAQVIHNDFNPENLLVDPDDPAQITGIIDFGDLVHAPLIVDVAVAISYQTLGREDPTAAIAGMTRAYHATVPLEEAELEVLPYLIAGRLAQSLVIGAWRAETHRENTEYILSYSDISWSTLRQLSSLTVESMTGAIRKACGMPAERRGRPADLSSLIERRSNRLGAGMRLSYSDPLHAVAGEGVWLIDANGERHLDAYNNVPQVGHSHPAVTAAIAGQSATLNTNTRYLVEGVLDYADRLVELFPKDLSVVVFANSGSEANDLAWRMAQTVTGNKGIVITEHAYHGATALTMATSPEELGIENLEPWVATVPAPDPRREPDGDLERALAELAKHGHRPAALAFDTVFSSDGIFDPTPGTFRAAAEQVREAGGLFIADEVQAGFGRVGERMWGFADQDFVPDIVTLGKPMGNGHPVAAVITTPAIAGAFKRRGYYFSTYAGNPVSTAAAMAVLDVISAENLPAKADRVGSYLSSGLRTLAGRHPSIGDVRGPGMFIGVELVTDGRPDPDLTRRVMDEMRRRRVLIGRTGLHGNVLKIRPPLVFDESHADLLVETLDETLTVTRA